MSSLSHFTDEQHQNMSGVFFAVLHDHHRSLFFLVLRILWFCLRQAQREALSFAPPWCAVAVRRLNPSQRLHKYAMPCLHRIYFSLPRLHFWNQKKLCLILVNCFLVCRLFLSKIRLNADNTRKFLGKLSHGLTANPTARWKDLNPPERPKSVLPVVCRKRRDGLRQLMGDERQEDFSGGL